MNSWNTRGDRDAEGPDGPLPHEIPPQAGFSQPAPDVSKRTPVEGIVKSLVAGQRLTERDLRPRRKRRVLVPVVLLLLTALSTFWAGSMRWEPLQYFQSPVTVGGQSIDTMGMRQSVLANAGKGVIYMACVMSILFAHEMGHFVATLVYRIPASLPYFLPFPIAPIGTMGAVIGLDGQRANRREIFDIGLAGPIAGLVLAVPILWVGTAQLDLKPGPGNSDPWRAAYGEYLYDCPLVVRWMIAYQHPEQPNVRFLRTSQVNAYFMAGWVGCLITGLNMLPVSQLDGGHVTYTLFGKLAHWIALLLIIGAVAYIVIARAFVWSLMVVLVLFIGWRHPPTADDRVPLGWPRILLGYASLLIPIVCFPPKGLMPVSFANDAPVITSNGGGTDGEGERVRGHDGCDQGHRCGSRQRHAGVPHHWRSGLGPLQYQRFHGCTDLQFSPGLRESDRCQSGPSLPSPGHGRRWQRRHRCADHRRHGRIQELAHVAR